MFTHNRVCHMCGVRAGAAFAIAYGREYMRSLVRDMRNSRRDFLRAAAVGIAGAAGAGIFSACGDATVAPTVTGGASGAATAQGARPATTGATGATTGAAPMMAAGTPKRGGTLTVAIQNDWVSLDPLFNSAEPNGTNMIYDQWFRWSPDAKMGGQWGPQPDLVAEWDLKENAATFKLRTGVKFTDGTPWDAKAAKWNLDRMIFHPQSTIRANLGGVDISKEDKAQVDRIKETASGPFEFSSKAVEAVDAATVRINLASPIAGLIAALSDASQYSNPVSPTAYNKGGKDAYGRNPVGTGPFRFAEWRTGSQVTLERNPDYWKKDAAGGALPYLDKIVYRLIVDDSVRLLDLRSGNVQFTELIQGKDVMGIRNESTLTLVQSETSGNNYRLIFDSTNKNSPFTKQKTLRQAMLHAIDRDAMLQVLGFGAGVTLKQLAPRGSIAYNEMLPFYGYDKAKATQLVREAVTKDSSIAGPDGKVAATITAINRAVDKAQAEMIKQFADTVGFNVKIEILERAAWVSKLVTTPGQPGGEFDFATMRNPNTADDPDGEVRAFYYSKGSFNAGHVNDPMRDMMIDKASASYNIEQRKMLYTQLSQAAHDDPVYGFLWKQNWNWAYNKRLKNFQEPVTNRWSFAETWLDS